MKKIFLLLTLLISSIGITWADQPFRNARYDGFKVLSPDNGSIVMIGNSITDMHIWQEVFRDKDGNPMKICNRGNSGSYATEQSENIESYLANKPQKVFMMIGTNDIATSGGLSTPSTPEVLLSYVKSIVTRIHKRSPETHIYLYPILNNNTTNRVKATWLSYNTLLKKYITNANDNLLTFVDIYDKMSCVGEGATAGCKTDWSNDQLHPNAAAFKIWAHEICQYLGDGVTSVYDNIDGDLTSVQNQGGMSSMHGARGSMFSVMPTTANDIVVLGGEGEIKTGEWWELLGNTNVKNRGTGWGYGGTIALTSQVLDAMYAETGASKTASPRAFFLYAGTNDVATSSANVTTAETAYKALVDKIFEKAPDTKIYVMGIHPAATVAVNTNVSAFNTWLKETLPGNYTDGKVKYVDTYTGLLNTSGTANTTYINTNNYLYGKGYAYFARQMAAAYNADFSDNQLTAPTEDEANARYTLATNRNTIGTVITANRDLTASTAVGGYTQTVVDAYNTELAKAYTLLESTSLTADEATAEVTALKNTLTVTAPTKANTSGKYFRLSTPNRGSRYLTCNGAGETMTGTTLGTGDNQVWQLEGRDDGSFDVKSVYDGSYMAMTSPITTTKTKPTDGWTFASCNTNGLFIIKSGSNQLNQQNASPYNILNWGSGTTLNDDGSNYKIEEVDGFAPTINYLMVYDKNAQTWVSSNTSYSLEQHAQKCIDMLNTVMENSGITGRYNLAGTLAIDDALTGTENGLSAATSNTAVLAKRYAVKADIVCVVVTGTAGESVGGSSIQAATLNEPANAVCSVLADNDSPVNVAHETAHVMGCNHSRTMSDAGTHEYAVAYENGIYHTLLSDGGSSATAVNHLMMLSGPDNIAPDGTTVMGTATADNTRMVKEMWNRVAGFSDQLVCVGVSETTWAPTASAQNKSLTVTCDNSFNITSSETWAKGYTLVEGKSGSEEYTSGCSSSDPFYISVEANTSTESRTATLTLTATGYAPATITITQEGASSLTDGKYYTIAGYVARNGGTTNYVLYDGTTRSMSTTAPTSVNGIWKAVKSGTGWKFESMKSQGNYLTYDGVSTTGAVYTITSGVSDGCVSMRPGDSYYSASSENGDMGGAYKSSNGTVQSDSYNWSTDWKITETEIPVEQDSKSTKYEVNGSTGTNNSSSYFATWSSTATVEGGTDKMVTIQVGPTSRSNMQTDATTKDLKIYHGKFTDCQKYTISAPTGYLVTGYNIVFKNTDTSKNVTLTAADGTTTATAESDGSAKLAVAGLTASSTYFTLSTPDDANVGADLTTFEVYIKSETESSEVDLPLTTTATTLQGKSGWVTGLVGTSNNTWSLPTSAAVVADLAAANTPSTGFYWGMGNGGTVCASTDVSGLTETTFNLVGRQAYTGSYAAQVYILDKAVKDVNVTFTAGGTVDKTSFSIWTLNDGTATCVAQSSSSALTSGTNTFSATDVNLPSGQRLIFIWNANNAGQTLNITGYSASYVEGEEEELPDTVEYTINSSTFTSYRDGTTASTGTTFVQLVKSNDTPTLQFGNSGTANNMNWASADAGANAQIFTGGSSCTYVLTAPTGYVIDSYSLTATNSSGNTNDMTLAVDGKTYHTLTAKSISASIVGESTVSFVLTGANQGVTLSDFKVKIVKDVPSLPKESTDTEKHWYYIVNAAASTVTYCTGKVMYADPSDSYKMKFGDKTFDANHLWCFKKNDSGKYAIQNYAGKYIGTAGSGTGNSTAFSAQDAENYIYNITSAYDYFTIDDGGVTLHAQQSNSYIVRWAAGEGNASLWRFKEVDCSEPAAAISTTNVQQGRVTTGIGNKNLPILRSTLTVTGLTGTAALNGVKGTVVATKLSDVTAVKIYKASNARELVVDAIEGANNVTWRESNATLLGSTTTIASDGTYSVTFDNTQSLDPGTYYLWIALDIASTATEGNTVDATITSYTVGTEDVAEESGNPANVATIFLSEGTVLMPKDKGVDKTNGSTYYRIPAITMVNIDNGDGTTHPRLVTLTDDRLEHNSDLPSHCYLVAQYSDDLGKTWTEPNVVAGTAETGGDYGHGDASLVTNRDNGEITGIMVSSGTYGHGFGTGTAAEPARWRTVTSKDGGVTWSTPKDFTDDLYGAKCIDETRQNWQSGFSGSGAALQMRDGTLVSSFVNRETTNGTTTQNFYFFMSNDGGATWHVSGTSGTTAADEPKALERNNGDLAISVRASGYNYHNISSDRGKTWKNAAQTRFTSGISGNACDGDYMVWCSSLEGNNVGTDDGNTVGNIAFITCPNNGSRQNLSIALSTDEGETFGTPKTICPCGSAYSSCAVLPDGTLGVYYEENGVFGGYTMRFVRFSLNWASGGKYNFDTTPFKPIASTKGTKSFSYNETSDAITIKGPVTSVNVSDYVANKEVTSIDLTGATLTGTVEAIKTAIDSKSNVSANNLIYAPTGTTVESTTNNVVVDNKCQSLVLTDGNSFSAPTNFTATSASYSRAMTNEWGTVCLPYAVTSNETSEAYYTIDGITSNVLTLTKVDGLAAGTPALVKRLSDSEIAPAATNVEVSGTSNPVSGTVTMIGSYTDGTKITDENAYYIKSNKFWQRAEKTAEITDPYFTINAFRAYFTVSSRARCFSLSVDEEGEATAIDAVLGIGTDNVSEIYGINGEKRSDLQHGINIIRMADGTTHRVIIK